MLKRLAVCLLLSILFGSVSAQERKQVYTTPSLPSREVLDRLNLRMAWYAHVPMEGRRDGLVSVQVNNGQVLALTRGGCLCAFDAETGRQQWRVTVGKAFDHNYTPSFNSQSVFVVTGVRLIVLDRASGAFLWEYQLPFAISAAPIVDEAKIYFSNANGSVSAFQLPSASDLDTVRPRADVLRTDDPLYSPERRPALGREIRPEPMWSVPTNLRLDYAPAVSGDSLFCASPNGTIVLLPKAPIADEQTERYRFRLDRDLTVAPSIYDDMAYVATTDTYVSAINIATGKVQWRFPTGGTVSRPIFVTEADVFVAVDNKGLIRLGREDGNPRWKLPYGKTKTHTVALADRVSAVNPKFVYAADSSGRLMVLDRALGTQLSFYEPFRDYTFPVANQTTDRLLLAANDGTLVCLHDREYEKPVQHRPFEVAARPGGGAKSLEEKLARKVTEKGAEAMPLVDALKGCTARYGVDFRIDDRAFADAGLPRVDTKPVLQPRVESQEVREVLKNILSQVGATTKIQRDVVWVVPTPKAGAVDAAAPADPAEKAVRDILAKKFSAPEVAKLTLTAMLGYFEDRLGLKFELDEKAFKAAGIDEVGTKEVQAKGQNIPFSTMLKDILTQAGAEYEVKGDKVIVRPAKK